MSIESLHLLELDLMTSMQAWKSTFLDNLMLFCNNFDTLGFYLLLIGFLWFFCNRKLGIRTFYIVLLGFILTQSLKALCQQPRPCQMRPELGMLFSKSYGFPSGASLLVASTFSYFAYHMRKQWFTVAAFMFALLVGFSRVYLGMHFFTDVVGGYFFGAALTYLFVLYSDVSWKKIESFGKWQPAVVTALFIAVYLLVPSAHAVISLAYGMTIGLLFAKFKKVPALEIGQTFSKRVYSAACFVVSVAPTLAALQLHAPQQDIALLFAGIWYTFAVPKLFALSQIKVRVN